MWKASYVISKHFCTEDHNCVILERENYSVDEWSLILDIFGLTTAETIHLTEYKIDVCGGKNDDSRDY